MVDSVLLDFEGASHGLKWVGCELEEADALGCCGASSLLLLPLQIDVSAFPFPLLGLLLRLCGLPGTWPSACWPRSDLGVSEGEVLPPGSLVVADPLRLSPMEWLGWMLMLTRKV